MEQFVTISTYFTCCCETKGHTKPSLVSRYFESESSSSGTCWNWYQLEVKYLWRQICTAKEGPINKWQCTCYAYRKSQFHYPLSLIKRVLIWELTEQLQIVVDTVGIKCTNDLIQYMDSHCKVRLTSWWGTFQKVLGGGREEVQLNAKVNSASHCI